LDGPRFRSLLTDLDALLLRDPATDRRRWVTKRAAKSLDRAERLFARARQAKPENRDAALHEARKAYKRGRYAIEVFEPSRKPARRLAKRLSGLQDVLGEHHDTVVLRELLREEGLRAFGAGENAFTYGLLYGRQHETANRLLGKLPKAHKAVQKSAKGRWN